MAGDKLDIFVFADWKGLDGPQLIGTLSAHQAKGKKAFSFEYEDSWLLNQRNGFIDPDISFYSGPQYPTSKENFGIFLDSMPDTWGRTLMKRKNAIQARLDNVKVKTLYDIDFLLEVDDLTRMGALRFKTSINGPFLNDDPEFPTPPWTSLAELQQAAMEIESDTLSKENYKWLTVLIAPGSSLGGARPKANILDKTGNLWIAKFPSKNDSLDKAKWEYLAYKLAVASGIPMSDCSINKIGKSHYTFLTKRFDRLGNDRIHFSSAMTMTGFTEEKLRNESASYLDIVEFIEENGANPTGDLHQLWRRITFNVMISNTDDHLRNHGFVLTQTGWVLSPAYDINPSINKNGLSLNIDSDNNALDIELVKSVGEYFRLNNKEMNIIISDIEKVVGKWNEIAKQIGISNSEILEMAAAFNY